MLAEPASRTRTSVGSTRTASGTSTDDDCWKDAIASTVPSSSRAETVSCRLDC